MQQTTWIAALAVLAALAAPAAAQVAGSTTLGVSITEASQVALGWSVKKSILGQVVYNESGEKVGKVEDLIVTPERNVSYVIIGAGGFIGIGRHDVAVPMNQIQHKGGRILMTGATKDIVKAMPRFEYTDANEQRRTFVASTEQELMRARQSVADLERRAAAGTAETKARLDLQVAHVQADLKAAEERLSEMRQAAAMRWHEFEGAVNAATTKLRKSLETAAA